MNMFIKYVDDKKRNITELENYMSEVDTVGYIVYAADNAPNYDDTLCG